MLLVSRYGLSVPLTSWWSLPKTTGPCKRPSRMASLNAEAISARPWASAYKMRACEPTTNWLALASRIQRRLSCICCWMSSGASPIKRSNTSAAMASVVSRSAESPLQHTQRNGPNP